MGNRDVPNSSTPDIVAVQTEKTGLTIQAVQFSPMLGDLSGNAKRIKEIFDASTADLVVFPECALTGYPLEDLVLRPKFVMDAEWYASEIADHVQDSGTGRTLLFGTPLASGAGKPPYNAAILASASRHVVLKKELPNYDVFDEKRTFRSGRDAPNGLSEQVFVVKGVKLGIMICEDMWKPERAQALAEAGADVLIVINGSPFEDGKWDTRMAVADARMTETNLPILYVNLVGGQDELVFDGQSFAIAPSTKGRPAMRLAQFREDSETITLFKGTERFHWGRSRVELADTGEAAIYEACKLGLRDYVNKNGFPGVIVGSSGGIDSALSIAIACDALGPERVWTIALPSMVTSPESNELAQKLAENLGCRFSRRHIGTAVGAFHDSLFFQKKEERHCTDAEANASIIPLTIQNVQARVRGVTLMMLSNEYGYMVLSTGNKSEMSVGYATLYGDMCGGFNVLKDLYKMQVYGLARYRNTISPVIPQEIIDRAPTAELAPGQKDEDDLPPYPALDAILVCLVEREMSVVDTARMLVDPARTITLEVVEKIRRKLDTAQYKRYQAPPGLKLSPRNFGRGRRYPITNHYKELQA